MKRVTQDKLRGLAGVEVDVAPVTTLRDNRFLANQQRAQIRAWIAELRAEHGLTPPELRDYVSSQLKN